MWIIGSFLSDGVLQRRAIVCLILFIASCGIIGFFTLHTSLTISFNLGLIFSITDANIESIEDISLDSSFFLSFPEFFYPTSEANWWKIQEKIYNILRRKDYVSVVITEYSGSSRQVQAMVGSMPLFEIIKRTWLIYFIALIYIISSLSVYQRHRSPPGTILSFFFLMCALYFTCAAPLVQRSITLHPLFFHLLIYVLHIAAGGLITLAHFAVVFPEPKEIVKRYPWITSIFYGYFIVVAVLYLFGITAFGTTFPTFCFWIVIIIGSFLHSLRKEREPFLKKQISLSLTAPVLASLFFILFYLLPGVLRTPPIQFTYFALFSLILPFALPLAMDNLTLYQEKLETERKAQQDKERIRDDLHDLILRNLAIIARSSEVSLNRLDRDVLSVRKRLLATLDLATDTSRQLRRFLQVIDESHNTWEEFCANLSRWGHEHTEPFNLEFDFDISPSLLKLPPPSLPLRVCLDQVVREAIVNVIKHARAEGVRISLCCRDDAVCCEIEDNGIGFDVECEVEGHFGLRNMKKRIEKLGGVLAIEPNAGQGTRITLQLPLR